MEPVDHGADLALRPRRRTGRRKSASPNVVIILCDDVGWGDLGCYGATKIKTPNLDGLAKDGMRFTDAHASAAVCTPTRYSLLTGEYSWRKDTNGLNKGVANGDSPCSFLSAAPPCPA